MTIKAEPVIGSNRGETWRREGTYYRLYDGKGVKKQFTCKTGDKYAQPYVTSSTGLLTGKPMPAYYCPGMKGDSLWDATKKAATTVAKVAVAPITVPLKLSADLASGLAKGISPASASAAQQQQLAPTATRSYLPWIVVGGVVLVALVATKPKKK